MIKEKLTWKVRDIKSAHEQRKRLWDKVKKYTGHPELVSWVAYLIRTNNVPERNDKALVRCIQKYAQQHIKFFREKPERFVSPLRTIEWGIGDCDDKSIFIASAIRSFRIPARLKFIRFDYPNKDGTIKKISHVYPLALVDNKWVALESVHPWPMGRDPEKMILNKGIKPEVFIIGDNR